MTTNEDHVLMEGNFCPDCASRNIETCGTPEFDSGVASQQVECHDCGGTWKDIYTLSGYQDFEAAPK